MISIFPSLGIRDLSEQAFGSEYVARVKDLAILRLGWLGEVAGRRLSQPIRFLMKGLMSGMQR